LWPSRGCAKFIRRGEPSSASGACAKRAVIPKTVGRGGQLQRNPSARDVPLGPRPRPAAAAEEARQPAELGLGHFGAVEVARGAQLHEQLGTRLTAQRQATARRWFVVGQRHDREFISGQRECLCLARADQAPRAKSVDVASVRHAASSWLTL
jgi:hypothetical protein